MCVKGFKEGNTDVKGKDKSMRNYSALAFLCHGEETNYPKKGAILPPDI
jgi:hypothetical protein